MTIEIWIVALVGFLFVTLWAVWVEASRLDRLHRKVAASAIVLDRQLVRRATISIELASAGFMDPVSSVLVGEAAFAALEFSGIGRDTPELQVPDLAAMIRGAWDGSGAGPHWAAGAAAPVDRERVESELSSTVRAVLEDPEEVGILREEPGGADLVDALAAAWYRVQLARRFHNEAVAQTQRVRRKLLIRLLRVAGHAPVPQTLEFDDAWPSALGRPGATSQASAV